MVAKSKQLLRTHLQLLRQSKVLARSVCVATLISKPLGAEANHAATAGLFFFPIRGQPLLGAGSGAFRSCTLYQGTDRAALFSHGAISLGLQEEGPGSQEHSLFSGQGFFSPIRRWRLAAGWPQEPTEQS